MSATKLIALREYRDEYRGNGFIRSPCSPAGSPIQFVSKKDGSLRLCVDNRGLNDITIKNRYTLPLINETPHRLQGACIYTELDLRGASNLLRIKDGEEWKTPFLYRYGQFEYLVMPFGLTNARVTFMTFMNDIHREHPDIFCVVHLDDLLVYSNTKEKHTIHIRTIFTKVPEAGVFGKPSKC